MPRPVLIAICLLLSATLIPQPSTSAGEPDLPDGVIAYAPLDENTRNVTVHTPEGAIRGVYYPADDPDHDTPEATLYDRYRVAGNLGKGLRFFAEDMSRAEIENFRLDASLERLCVSVFVKPGGENIASLVSSRTDSDVHGFALFKWGQRLRFQYGDGDSRHVIESSGVPFADDEWQHLQVVFDGGEVAFYHNGVLLGTKTGEGRRIAPGHRSLTLGNYPVPGRGRERYSFNGVMDEVVLANTREAADQLLASVSERHGQDWYQDDPLRILDATPQPIEGNEPHFGGPVFHSFHGRPVPMTFVFKGEAERIESAALILEVPEAIQIREAFTGSRNYPDRRVEMSSESIQRDGQSYTRYRTVGFDFADRLAPTYQNTKSPSVTVALDGPASVSAQVHWALEVNGRRYGDRSFELRVLEPMAVPEEPGRFKIFSFAASAEMTYYEPALQEAVADLYLSSNIRGKGRFYSSHPERWTEFDDYLSSRGFELFELGLWHGPIKGGLPDDPPPPPAVRADGSEDERYKCPTRYLNSNELRERYKAYKQKRLNRMRDGEWAVLDYEPWGVVGSICFCDACVSAFRERYEIAGELSPESIKSDHREQWVDFWLHHSAETTKLMHELVKEHDPSLRVLEYTYFFDYADEEALQRRFWSIAKDPRRHEAYVDAFLLSAYHVNGREYFDLLGQSVATLESPIQVIASLSRANALQGRYTPPEESLSPDEMFQKAVLSGAYGIEWFGLYPGNWIDGAYHQALHRASELVWQYESYFAQGSAREDLVNVLTESARNDYAVLGFQKENSDTLVTIFNFTQRDAVFDLAPASGAIVGTIVDDQGERYTPIDGELTVEIPANGVRMIEWRDGR